MGVADFKFRVLFAPYEYNIEYNIAKLAILPHFRVKRFNPPVYFRQNL